MQEVAGEFSTTARATKIRTSIHKAIEKFEPRIIPGSLDVILRDEAKSGQTIVTFDIAADMWAQPLAMELYLRSEVDITTGELKLERAGPGAAPVRKR